MRERKRVEPSLNCLEVLLQFMKGTISEEEEYKRSKFKNTIYALAGYVVIGLIVLCFPFTLILLLFPLLDGASIKE